MKLVGVLVGISAALLLAQPVGAAQPVATSTITLNEPSPVTYGDTVTFTTEVGVKSGKGTVVYIEVACYQNGRGVYVDTGWVNDIWLLVSTPATGFTWDGGAASCTATLTSYTRSGKNVSIQSLATTSFDVIAAP
jgi:hypothetical protein